MTPFHLSFLVRDLDETRRFYADVLGCEIGRSSEAGSISAFSATRCRRI